MKIRVEFKLEDFWIGVYWRQTPQTSYDYFNETEHLIGWQYDVWVCLLPCLPVHITWERVIRKNTHSAEKTG